MADTRNKRKFDDSGPNISYNRVPPPPSDFELAKKKAMQIVARINAAASDSARDDSYAQDEKTSSHNFVPDTRSRYKFDDYGAVSPEKVEIAKQRAQQILARFAAQEREYPEESDEEEKSNQAQNSSPILQNKKPELSTGSSYGSYGPPESRKVEIPNAKVGLVIGKGGDTIKQIQLQSGARVQITKDMDHNPNVPFRTVELMGTPEQIERAEQAIHDVIAEADAAAANSIHSSYTPAGEQVQLTVPTNKLVPLMGPPEYQSGVAERVLAIVGSKEQVDAASELIKELISENRGKPPTVQGAYQGYPPPSGPPQWGPVVQQQGYGFQQGPYYSGRPQPYGSYPSPSPGAWSQPLPAPPRQYQAPVSYGYYNHQGQMEYPQTTSYEHQVPFAEHPPGASQDVYGQQISGQDKAYGQMRAYGTYGSTELSSVGPPGVTTTIDSQNTSHEGFGPPGIGRQTADQGPPGVGPVEGMQNSSHQSSLYSYDDSTAGNFGQHETLASHYGPPGPTHADGQQVPGQVNYGYWNNGYGYAGYEAYQSGYGQQIAEHSAYGQPPYQQQEHPQVPYEENQISGGAHGMVTQSSNYQQVSQTTLLGQKQGGPK